MATSGTYVSRIRVVDFVTKALRRCGVPSGKITGEHTQIAREALFDMLTTLNNQGVNLWKIQQMLMGNYDGRGIIEFPSYVLDVDRALYRTPQFIDYSSAVSSDGGVVANAFDQDIQTVLTQSAPNGNVSCNLVNPVKISMVGFLPGATGSRNLVWEVSQNGTTWTTVLAPGATTYTDGEWAWYDVLDVIPAPFIRVRETSGGILIARELAFCSGYTEILMAVLNQDMFANLPNRQQFGSPLQYWMDRQRDVPRMWIWQVPTDTFKLINAWTRINFEDIGLMTNELDVPRRWTDAVGWDLAKRCMLECEDVDGTRMGNIKEMRETTWTAATNEERTQGPIDWVPDLSPYTR